MFHFMASALPGGLVIEIKLVYWFGLMFVGVEIPKCRRKLDNGLST